MDEKIIKVRVHSNSPVIVYGISKIFESQKDIEVVNSTLNVESNYKPDVIIVDYKLPFQHIQSPVAQCTNSDNPCNVLLLIPSKKLSDNELIELLIMGVKGYVAENAKAEDFTNAVKTIYKGELFINNRILSKLLCHVNFLLNQNKCRTGSHIQKPALTPRERQITELIIDGHSNKKIAYELFITVSTVKTHIQNIFKKLGVTSRDELKRLSKPEGTSTQVLDFVYLFLPLLSYLFSS